MRDSLPLLTPIVSDWMIATLTDKRQINHLFESYGSPLNLHHLEPFRNNYHEYAQLLERHQVPYFIFFARKANKCQAFVEEAKRSGFGVDTASYRELLQCLEIGYDSDRLVLTAAIKNKQVVELAVSNDVLIILDNEDECCLVNQVAKELGKKAKIGLRIGNFTIDGTQLYSRFGFQAEDAVYFIKNHIGTTYKALLFKGFHFHLNGYSRYERAVALHTTIQYADALRAENIPTEFIDIGGGLLMNYLRDSDQWHRFMAELKRALRSEREPITFNNNGLGLQLFNGEIIGQANVYPYYNQSSKADFLQEILTYRPEKGQTLASMLRQRKIELRLEPGRSLLDQTGMTVARVNFRKIDSRGDRLVGLEMNRSQLFSSSADFLLDPYICYQSDPYPQFPPKEGVEAGYFVGAFCLEQDVILKRKLPFARTPEIGDYVAFVNTAGYMMHFYETNAHLFDLSKNLVDITGTQKKPRFQLAD